MVARKTLREAFDRRVEKIPGGCWIWHGDTINTGYGRLRYHNREQLAHRISWELTHGQPVPKGMWVFHSCDNPLCVNPAHLYVGRPHYAQLGQAKLSEDTVRTIRAEWQTGSASMGELARRFGVNKRTIFRVVHGDNWSYVTDLDPGGGAGGKL